MTKTKSNVAVNVEHGLICRAPWKPQQWTFLVVVGDESFFYNGAFPTRDDARKKQLEVITKSQGAVSK